MIWDLIQESTFNQHFGSQNLEVETLLLDQNIITELKNLNPQLLEYINQNKQQFIKKLIYYSTVMPTKQQSSDRCYKLPYISSELLALDSDIIYDALITQNQQNWKLLIAILKTKAVYNPVLMGYFEKIVCNLYNGRKKQTTTLSIKYMHSFLINMDKEAIESIISNCLIPLNEEEGFLLNERQSLLKEVISLMVNENQQYKKVCCLVLTSVIHKFQIFSSGDTLLTYILKSEQFFRIYTIHDSQAIVSLIIGLLSKCKQTIIKQNDTPQPIIILPNEHKQKISEFIIAYSDRIKKATSQIQPKYIMNQQHHKILKCDNRIMQFFQLMLLAVQNKIINIFTQKILNWLWEQVQLHPYSDMLMVVLFKIMSKTIKFENQFRKIILKQYSMRVISFSQDEMRMYAPHLFTLWYAIKQEGISFEIQQAMKQKWNQLQKKYFDPMLHHHNKAKVTLNRTNKFTKLVVDEEDQLTIASAKTISNINRTFYQRQNIQNRQQNLKQEKNSKVKEKYIKQEIQKQTTESKKNRQKIIDPFAAFDISEESSKVPKAKDVSFKNFGSFL